MKIPIILTRKELMRLIAVPEADIESASSQHQLFNSIRNAAMLRLLCSSGLRIQELANLNRSNIFPQEQRIKVRQGKKGNEDYIPVVNDATWKSLERYEKSKRDYSRHRGSLFCGLEWTKDPAPAGQQVFEGLRFPG